MLQESVAVEPASTPEAQAAAAPAPAPEKPEAAAPAPAEPESYADKLAAQEKALDDDLRETFRKASGQTNEEQPRAENGKFAPKAAPEGQPKADQPAVEPKLEPKPEAPKIAAPASMPKELHEKFAAAPPEVQKFIADREAEAHKAISNMGRQVKGFEPIAKVLEQNRATFERNGATYEQGLSALIAAQNALDQNPENGIAYLAQTYGVDLRSLVARMYGQQIDQNGLDAGPNPEVAALKAELAQVRRQQEYDAANRAAHDRAANEQRQMQQRAVYESKIDAFAKDKPDFYEVAPDVLANIAAIQQTNPSLSADELISQAYERAIWANPKTRDAKMKAAEAARLAEAAKQATEAKRANGINVRGVPKSADPASLDEDLRAIFRKNAAR